MTLDEMILFAEMRRLLRRCADQCNDCGGSGILQRGPGTGFPCGACQEVREFAALSAQSLLSAATHPRNPSAGEPS